MLQGLQVFDAQGNLTLDTSDRVMKILGTLYCNRSNQVDSEFHAGLDEGDFFWFFIEGSGQDYSRVTVTRDTYINNVGSRIPRVTMRLKDSYTNNYDSYFIGYGVY